MELKFAQLVKCKHCGQEIKLSRAMKLSEKHSYVCSKCKQEGVRS